jgi:hypothetical protein
MRRDQFPPGCPVKGGKEKKERKRKRKEKAGGARLSIFHREPRESSFILSRSFRGITGD